MAYKELEKLSVGDCEAIHTFFSSTQGQKLLETLRTIRNNELESVAVSPDTAQAIAYSVRGMDSIINLIEKHIKTGGKEKGSV